MLQVDSKPRVIAGYPSIFLDSIRIAASLAVLFYHVGLFWYPFHPVTGMLRKYGHTAVTVFFVLSGYVIAYMANSKKSKGLYFYLESRFSKLFSAAIPVMLITGVIELLVAQIHPELHTALSRGPSWPRYIFTGLFLNEVWFRSLAPPINSPMWSLGYEFWYYVIFGLFFFKKGSGWKAYLPGIVACIVAGPKILLMMPIWLFGYYAYKLQRLTDNPLKAWVLVSVFSLIALGCVIYVKPYPGTTDFPPLFFAGEFATDWLTGFFIAAAFWCLPSVKPTATTLKLPALRQVAELTFPLYILHYPLIVLHVAITHKRSAPMYQLLLEVIAIIAICTGIGLLTEKYRYLWVNLIRYFKNKLSPESKALTEAS